MTDPNTESVRLGNGLRQITITRGGKTITGLAYWSDRTIPGKWIYPNDWHIEESHDHKA